MATKKVTSSSVLTPVANKKRKEVLVKEKPRFRLHADADRDGKVDDNPHDVAKWEWGAKKKGAVLLVNHNDSDGDTKLDGDDAKVNGAKDIKDIAALQIRRTGPVPDPAWKLTLSIDAKLKGHVRIFDALTAAGTEVIGPAKGGIYVLPDLSFDRKELGVEAIRYAEDGFDGLVKINLVLQDGAGAELSRHSVTFRVAPWLMFNHTDEPEQIYVVTTLDNPGFVTALSAASAAAGIPLKKIDGAAWGGSGTEDRWMQDIMEFGFSELPGQAALRSVIETPRGRDLQGFPKTLLSDTLGYYLPAKVPARPSSLNSGGNLECTPPFTAPNGKKFPFGRIYHCPFRASSPTDGLPAEYRSFLAAQVVQKPIAIDAGWLSVGHVDEIISFVPAPSTLGFKLLLASPKLGYKLLQGAPATSKMLIGRDYVPGASAETSVDNFLKAGINWPAFVMTAKQVHDYNLECQADIDKAEAIFKKAIGLKATDIAHVPIIYIPANPNLAILPKRANALTAGMVNMLVLGKNCIAPKPFGPEVAGKDLFEENYRQTLAALGMSITFVDDWATYHLLQGEVHCGTNTLRKPDVARKWWEFEP